MPSLPISGRARSRSRDFLDLISHRMVAAFAAAGAKYRPHRAADVGVLAPGRQRADPVAEVLLALTGYATPRLAERLLAGASPLRHYAGFFSAHPRSSDRLEALASDWLGRPVKVEQFAGAWMAAAARPAHAPAGGRVARRVWPVESSMQRPACAPGTSRRESCCRSGRSTCRTSSGFCPIGRCCASWSRWCAPMSASKSALPSIPCSPATPFRRWPCPAGRAGRGRRGASAGLEHLAADIRDHAPANGRRRRACSKAEIVEGRCMSQSWTSGYVADVAYIEGFYIQQSPARMALACLFGNVAVDLPEPDDQACYLELGCGCRHRRPADRRVEPGMAGHGHRLQPRPYRHRRRARPRRAPRQYPLRRSGPLAARRQAPRPTPFPRRTSSAMHGLWSWVSNEVRAGIVRLLAAKTRPGGMVHVSYNALPAWQGAHRHATTDLRGRHPVGRPQRPAGPGRACAGARDQGSTAANISPRAPGRATSSTPPPTCRREYLSHEYMSAHWAPAFHADVAAAMAEAKLDWVASANPLENFPELMLTAGAARVDGSLQGSDHARVDQGHLPAAAVAPRRLRPWREAHAATTSATRHSPA